MISRSIIRGFFRRFGPVVDVFIPPQISHVKKLNYAFVRFESPEAAHMEIAISDEKWLFGRRLVVRK